MSCIIGPNNQGKTNLSHAIRLLFTIIRTVAQHGNPNLRTHYSIHGPNSPDAADRLLTKGEFPISVLNENLYNFDRDYPVNLINESKENPTNIEARFEIDDGDLHVFSRREDLKPLVGSLKELDTLILDVTLKSRSMKVKATILNPVDQLSRVFSSVSCCYIIDQIMSFLLIKSQRNFQYATEMINDFIVNEFKSFERTNEYKEAMKKIEEIKRPIEERLESSILQSMREFVPDLNKIQIETTVGELFNRYGLQTRVSVDDGTLTSLNLKGDGVQSLAVLGILRYLYNIDNTEKKYLIIIEEPEAHLHSNMIHEVKRSIDKISKSHQVIVTTHHQIFCIRDAVYANIIVNKNTAFSASSLSQIRDILGVRPWENLTSAECVLLVEGNDDKNSLTLILRRTSEKISAAMDSGVFVIESLGSASRLTAFATLYSSLMCKLAVLLDHDAPGIDAFKKARERQLLTEADCVFTCVPGRRFSEFEDLINFSIVVSAIKKATSVDVTNSITKWRSRFSDSLKKSLQKEGKILDDSLLFTIKTEISKAVCSSDGPYIRNECSEIIDSLTSLIESKI